MGKRVPCSRAQAINRQIDNQPAGSKRDRRADCNSSVSTFLPDKNRWYCRRSWRRRWRHFWRCPHTLASAQPFCFPWTWHTPYNQSNNLMIIRFRNQIGWMLQPFTGVIHLWTACKIPKFFLPDKRRPFPCREDCTLSNRTRALVWESQPRVWAAVRQPAFYN